MNLSELLDSAYETEVWLDHKSDYIVQFNDDGGRKIEIALQKLANVDVWSLEFTRDFQTKITGAGDAPKILSTVGKAVQEFLKKKTPAFVFFAAAKGDRARAAVYRRMIKRLSVQHYTELKYPEDRMKVKDPEAFDKIWMHFRRAGDGNEFMVIAHVDELVTD